MEEVLDDNPGLKPRIEEAIGRAYRKARIEAAKETGLEEADFPETCPYGFDAMMTRAFCSISAVSAVTTPAVAAGAEETPGTVRVRPA